MESIRFMTSLILFYLKGEFSFDQNFVKIKVPNTILALIPLGSQKVSLPVNQLSSVESSFSLKLKRLIVGLIVTVLGFNTFSESFLLALILLVVGLNAVITSFETELSVQLTSGDVKTVMFLIFEKKTAEKVENNIGKLIAGRMDDTNTRQQTDRIVDAINNK